MRPQAAPRLHRVGVMSSGRPAALGARSIEAVLWGAGGAAARLLLQVGAQVVLARLLGPEQYGVFAIGATVVAFSAFLSDIGLAYGLIQKPVVEARDIRFVFSWQIVLGLGVAALVYFSAGPVAGYFNEPRAHAVVQALAAVCLLNALTAPALNLLKRDLNFKAIQIAQLAGYVSGYLLVGIPLALLGAQVWALVAAWIVQALVIAALLYARTRHPLAPLFWYGEAARQSSYGLVVLLTNLINWAIANIDRIIVGRVFGSRDIGLYATTYNLLYNPSATLLGVVQPVFFSASSRLVDERARIADGFRALLATWALLIVPAFAFIATMSDAFIVTLYGSAWHAAAALCRPLALVMPLFLLFGLSTPLLWTTGRAVREFQLQLPMALLWIGACTLASRHSTQAVAWSVLALHALRTGVVVAAAMRAVGLPLRDLWRSTWGGLLACVALTAATLATDAALPAQVAPLPRLLLAGLAALLAWWGAVQMAPKALPPEFVDLARRLGARSALVGALFARVFPRHFAA